MGRMKSCHDFPPWSVLGLLFAMFLWSAAPNALVSAGDLVKIQLRDGDSVQCLPIELQPSLKDAKHYQASPNTVITPGKVPQKSTGAKLTPQTFVAEGHECPLGTIPVRANRGVWGRASKSPAPSPAGTRRRRLLSEKPDGPAEPHEYAVGMIDKALAKVDFLKGTEVYINIWQPFVESLHEFSVGQFWLTSGETKSMEAGYECSKGHYGDELPRFFVYWTADRYINTGCYDLRCPGFVQVSNKVLLGGSFVNISEPSDHQYEIKLLVFEDDSTGNWWLQLNDENVGYWPKEIYSEIPFGYATLAQWGGEVLNYEPTNGEYYTRTQMGSGQFSNMGFGKAAYVRGMQYVNDNHELIDAPITLYNSIAGCYSVSRNKPDSTFGSYIYYGGPGRNDACLHDPPHESTSPLEPPSP